jgi:polysaccharide deacetylase family protein (PEP-CTERM system associated)
VTNVFTVDVEEWFHVCGVDALSLAHWDRLPSRVQLTTRRLLDMLDGAGVRATFFVVGWLAERHPQLVEEITAAGHEVASHGHLHRRVYELTRDEFRRDLLRSREALRAAGAGVVTMFRAPEWSIGDQSLWALDVLGEEGFAIDASMAPLKLVGSTGYPRRPHLRQTSAALVLEAPPLVCDRFGQVMPIGWGWGLRMSSPTRVCRAIDAVNEAGHPAVVMVHPWEIDPQPPRVKLPLRQHFAHYFRLDGFAGRLNSILRGARFGPLSTIASGELPLYPE